MADQPTISSSAAARAYHRGQTAAARGPQPSTAETRTQLGSARTSGNQAAGTRA